MSARVYKVPDAVFELGKVLEAAIEVQPGEIVVIREWRGMWLLSEHNAFNLSRPRLYLVRSKAIAAKSVNVPQRKVDQAAESYDRWHKREADKLFELNAGTARHPLGRLLRLDYRSDKWHAKGKTVEYTHDFTEGRGKPPMVYADRKGFSGQKTVIATGGTMRVTEAGIA